MRFTKMHGAGNDFVVLDLRAAQAAPSPLLWRLLGDRHRGVGCDQILTVEAARDSDADARYAVWNSDGSPAGQCGNGARCVAAWLAREDGIDDGRLVLESPAGLHEAERIDADRWRIGMGRPHFAPAEVPMRGFDAEQDVYAVDIGAMRIEFGAVSMGNPHALVEVEDIQAAPVARIGAALQSSPVFPDSVNVGFAQVVSPGRVRLRVFERGAGETLACGSGACAVAAILMRRGRIDRRAMFSLPGGDLMIEWPDDRAGIAMTGPVAFVYTGVLDAGFLRDRHP